MKNYEMSKIRNITLIGNGGTGKTSLAEQMLFNSKSITRRGRISDGNTTLDFDPAEISKGMSISLAIGNLTWNNKLINIIDTPGYSDFIGEQICAVSAVENILLVTNAANGFEVGLEASLDNTAHAKVARSIVVNMMDSDKADYEKVISSIKEHTDFSPIPLVIPVGKGKDFVGVIDLITNKAYIDNKVLDIPAEMADETEAFRTQMVEAVAETDENLLDKYFEEGDLSVDELTNGIKKAIAKGEIIPTFACSAETNVGVNKLMDAIIHYLPSPEDFKEMKVLENNEEKDFICSPDGEILGFIFKTQSDPSFGDIAYVRLFSGSITSGTEVYIQESKNKDKVGNMFLLNGKNRKDTHELKAGEIAGFVKLKHGEALSTICEIGSNLQCKPVVLPTPRYWKAIHALKQSDDDKIGAALTKLIDEEPTAVSYFDEQTHENVIAGLGSQQILNIQKKLKSRYGVDVEMTTPNIPYKETIEGKADKEYKHKKQSGGRGQYGHVHFRISPKPRGEGFEFINSIVGGSIPSKFIPAIEKGIQETLKKGIVAGYQIVDIAVDCYYGSYHDVDSSEMAFKIAASQCLRKCFTAAKPILLEPIHEMEIVIPSEYMGDVMGDISTRRGKISGMVQKGKKQILKATIPLVELYEYFPILKSLTQGRGRFTQEFSHYEKVPKDIAKKIIEAYDEHE